MQNAYPFFIFLCGIGLVVCALFVYGLIKAKNKKPFWIFCVFLWFLLPLLLAAGMLFDSQKLIFSGIFFPVSLFAVTMFIGLLVRYRKCTCVVSAKYTSFVTTTHRGVTRYAPTFSFGYNGEGRSANSFIYYSKRKFQRLFEDGNTYDVFINPQDPTDCVDKRCFPISYVVALLFFALFFLLGAGVILLI